MLFCVFLWFFFFLLLSVRCFLGTACLLFHREWTFFSGVKRWIKGKPLNGLCCLITLRRLIPLEGVLGASWFISWESQWIGRHAQCAWRSPGTPASSRSPNVCVWGELGTLHSPRARESANGCLPVWPCDELATRPKCHPVLALWQLGEAQANPRDKQVLNVDW